MDLWQSLRILRRRWVIVAAMMLLTVGGIAGALQRVPPTYETKTTLLLVMPAKADPKSAAVNPYLNFGSTLIVTGRVLSEAMTQDGTAQTLKNGGAEAGYAVAPDPWGQSPTLVITASDRDPEQVALTLQRVVDATKQELADRQRMAGAPEASWISAVTVTAPGKLSVKRGDQIRVIAFLGAIGGVLALLLAFGADGWQRRRVMRWADAVRTSEPVDSEVAADRLARTAR